MNPGAHRGRDAVPATDANPGLRRLEERILHAAHLLPAQGPIGVFIHHNTLHAFEDRNFDDAVRAGAGVFGCEPYLPEVRYRDELDRGRIQFSELREVLEQDLGTSAAEIVGSLSSRLEIRLALLQHPLLGMGGAELDWWMAETEALTRVRPDVSGVSRRRLITETRHWVLRRLRGSSPETERPRWIEAVYRRFGESRIEDWSDETWESFTLSALWEACRDGLRRHASPAEPRPPRTALRLRDCLVEAGASDPDAMVDDVLIRYCAAFLDQGIAHWEMPGRDSGFLHAARSLNSAGSLPSARWLEPFAADLNRIPPDRTGALSTIQECLAEQGIPEAETDAFLAATLLALRGWAGMLWHVEQRADRVHHPVPPGTLVEFLAVRLLLERHALRAVARESLGFDGSPTDLRSWLATHATGRTPDTSSLRAFLVFQIAQVLGWTPERLSGLPASDWAALLAEVEGFDSLERRRVFHLAYEHRFRVRTLDALASRAGRSFRNPSRPSFQAVFCIDEREESIRRHVEEAAPTAETFGAAGFFGVVMYYRGAAAADFVPLCPVVVRPKHWVSEVVDRRLADEDRRRRSTRRQLGMALHGFHGGSRRIVSGAFLSASLGLLATIPLVGRVVFPRLTARFRGFLGSFIAPPPLTRLQLERATPNPSPSEADHGFLPGEMADICERLLRDIGLTQGFARLIFVFGHGSSSLNNPHESAHDCGACGGGVGGPNARAVAEMLGDPRIRRTLRERGIDLPDDVVFVGGLHNTANDDVTFFDVDRVPATHRFEFDVACQAMREAATRNSHERARRFGSAPLGIDPTSAKRHMEGRSEDLSQVRPEWGHATNALCIVGRRSRSRGLFLDRRPFLVSYDPTKDDADSTILARILGAVFPVCSGINLEYYFSCVDSPGWGCGSKLPHNITGLLGVMDGARSDLRTGLPWQMVEIHEPMRLLFVIETRAEAFESIMNRNPAVRTLVTRQWVQVALMDPDSQALSVFRDGRFEPYLSSAGPLPVAATSREWYSGWRDQLEFAEIVAGQPQPA